MKQSDDLEQYLLKYSSLYRLGLKQKLSAETIGNIIADDVDALFNFIDDYLFDTAPPFYFKAQ